MYFSISIAGCNRTVEKCGVLNQDYLTGKYKRSWIFHQKRDYRTDYGFIITIEGQDIPAAGISCRGAAGKTLVQSGHPDYSGQQVTACKKYE